MSDIVERLRRNCPGILDSEVRMEAADEIERLRNLLREWLDESIVGRAQDLERRTQEALGDE
jgi:hypothetical protein